MAFLAAPVDIVREGGFKLVGSEPGRYYIVLPHDLVDRMIGPK